MTSLLLMTACHGLRVPDVDEARRLTDCCPDVGCLTFTDATAVLDLPNRRGCVAAYSCASCGVRWLCSWQLPHPSGQQVLATTKHERNNP